MSIEKLQRKTVATMQPYEGPSAARAACKLDQNESPYDAPEAVKRRILRRLKRAPFNRYPDSFSGALRSLLAARLKVKPERVTIGAGIDELLYSLTLAFVEKGDKVLYFEPSFSMYKICCSIAGARGIAVRLDGNWQLPEKFVTESRTAKLTFICRPNNPTGNCIPLETVEKIVQESSGLVCIDEAYVDFADDDCLTLLKYPNVVLLRTLSKAFGAAGARVGYAVADMKVIACIDKVRQPWNLSVFSQIAAEELLRAPKLFASRVQEIKSERKRVLLQLRLLGIQAYDSQTNFILLRVNDSGSEFTKLLEQGILVRKFSSPLLQNCLRVSIGTRKENDLFLAGLARVAVDAILFDIDSTLVDVSRSYLEAIRLTAEKISGRKVPASLVKQVKSLEGMNNDWDATVEVLRRMGVKASRRKVVPVFQDIYFGKNGEGFIRKETPLVNLALLKKIRKPIGIVTGRPSAEAKIALKMLGLAAGTPLVAMEDTKSGKPDAVPLLLAKKRLGAKLPLYIGDSADDRMAANNAGMAFVAIGRGKRQAGEFSRFASVNEAIRGLLA